ncbi:MAG: division/cell wall cluster transcriptional repressor MraZ [Candidatus Stahlbacteria bacterium]|nr:MAG: division/cell wall cluster transcriptional repressor MraZ [Candidatus Stahlbacteria bacterium]
MYFIGNDIYSVDHKGRVFIPVKFRAVLNEEDDNSFYITKGFETSLLLFPLSKWYEFIEQLREKKYSQKTIRDAIRAFSYGAECLTMDSQGRVVLPKDLRDYAKIKDGVFFLGAIDKVELWSPSIFEKYSKDKGDTNELFSLLEL